MERMIKRESLEEYFRGTFRGCRLLEFTPLGRGVHGRGYLVALDTEEGKKAYVLKAIDPEGLGHDYPADRAGMLIHALDCYGNLPKHVKAVDVLSLQRGGTLSSIGGGTEYFLLMEKAEGMNYFSDLEGFSKKRRLDETDKRKITLMAEYLAEIHRLKRKSRTLYLRKLRDIIGHGECLMGVFDAYPEGVLSYKEMAGIEKMCIDWRARLKHRHERLSQIHGDFHPGNIWWGRGPSGKGHGPPDFILLDRSRGPWGEPADDVTALTINYIFFSIKSFDAVAGAYLEGLKLFYEQYIKATGDEEILEVAALFFAFRGAVVANPVFYPGLTPVQRDMILGFVKGVLQAERFEPEKAAGYVLSETQAIRSIDRKARGGV